jgi:hypothetical protein
MRGEVAQAGNFGVVLIRGVIAKPRVLNIDSLSIAYRRPAGLDINQRIGSDYPAPEKKPERG